jgi:hypothetical protein
LPVGVAGGQLGPDPLEVAAHLLVGELVGAHAQEVHRRLEQPRAHVLGGGQRVDRVINAMIAVVEAEAVTAAPELRDWLMSLAAFTRRAADRHMGVVSVLS